MSQLLDPVEFALQQALLSIKRMEQRLPAITFNRDALYAAFDAARAYNAGQTKEAARYRWLEADDGDGLCMCRHYNHVEHGQLAETIDKEIENAK